MKYIDITEQRFGRLVAKQVSHRDEHGNEFWHCLCDCGGVKTTWKHALTRGGTQSCGCLCKERTKKALTTHGKRKSVIYQRWLKMRAACDNPKHPKYVRYGAKGINYCARWKTFANFYADMGDPPPNCSLQRIDKSGDFSPENCQWVAQLHSEERQRRNDVYIRKYIKRRRIDDPGFIILCRLRVRLRHFLRGNAKAAQTMHLVGCTREFLINHLLAPFPKGTQLSDLLKSHSIDHIRPCTLFNPQVEAEQRACFNWRNLQLLLHKDNSVKNSKWNGQIQKRSFIN
jgi:hypothetical protein